MSDDPRKSRTYRPHPTLGDCRELASEGDGPCWGCVQDRKPQPLDIFWKGSQKGPALPLCTGHRHAPYGAAYIQEFPS